MDMIRRVFLLILALCALAGPARAKDELVLGIAGALDREFGYTPSPLIEHVG